MYKQMFKDSVSRWSKHCLGHFT